MPAPSLPRSGYFYQMSKMNQPDKYIEVRTLIKNIIQESRDWYGYRRIWKKLQQ